MGDQAEIGHTVSYASSILVHWGLSFPFTGQHYQGCLELVVGTCQS